MFEYYGDIHVYCPGVGAYEPLGSIFFRIINIQSNCPFSALMNILHIHVPVYQPCICLIQVCSKTIDNRQHGYLPLDEE